ncbi:MAG: HPP family protein [Longimicrobiaceae bacterium]
MKFPARTVREVMEPRVVSVVPEMTVRELVETFQEEHIRGAPVLDPAGKVIGMVSESDVLRHALASPARGVRVGDIMGPVGATFAPGDELQALSRFFAADGVQRVAVIENDILLGIVTPADVLRGLASSAR